MRFSACATRFCRRSCSSRPGTAASAAGAGPLAVEPRRHAVVGELGVIADRARDRWRTRVTVPSAATVISMTMARRSSSGIERRQVRRQLLRQHRKDLGRGVDRGRVDRGMVVDGRALRAPAHRRRRRRRGSSPRRRRPRRRPRAGRGRASRRCRSTPRGRLRRSRTGGVRRRGRVRERIGFGHDAPAKNRAADRARASRPGRRAGGGSCRWNEERPSQHRVESRSGHCRGRPGLHSVGCRTNGMG